MTLLKKGLEHGKGSVNRAFGSAFFIPEAGHFPLPLFIVGTKIDKMSPPDLENLRRSCPHHLLTSILDFLER